MSENKTTIINILSTVILQGIAFFSSPYFSRVLGTEGFGVVSVFLVWTQIASIVLGMKIDSVVAIGSIEYPKEKQKEFQSSVFSISCLTFTLSSIVIIAVTTTFFSGSILMVVCVLINAFGLHCVNFLNNKFAIEFRADLNLILSVVVSISSIVLSIYLINVWKNNDIYWGRIIGQTVPYLFASIGTIFFIFYTGKLGYNKKYWKFCIPLALPVIFHSLSGIVLSQSDRLMIQMMTSYSDVGIYSLSYTFSNVLFVVWTALNNSWVPFYYKYMENNNSEAVVNKSKNYLELFTIITIGFILLSKEVYHIFAGKEYWGGTNLIPIFALGTFFIFLYGFPINYEFYRKKTKSIAYVSGVGAALNIALNYFLIGKYSIGGAAIATMVSYIAQFALHHYSCLKIDKKNGDYPYRIAMFLPYVISVIGSLIFFLLIDSDLFIIRWIFAFMLGIFELIRIYKRKSIF